jgi:hypothetical protein
VKRKANSNVSEQPSKIIRSELQKVEENNLTENDLKSLSMAIHRERRKRHLLKILGATFKSSVYKYFFNLCA